MLNKTIDILDKEFWFGGAVNEGYLFPLSKNSRYSIDFSYNDTYNQINPLLVSSAGRYIWLEDAGEVCFADGKISIRAKQIEFDQSSFSLKQAQQKAAHRHFPSNGRIPDETAFRQPQLCSWIDLKHEQNQKDILDFARGYISSGYQPGIIIIDDKWQKDYGDWDFNTQTFPAPKMMMEQLRRMGFKVLLWLVPYISFNCRSATILKENNALIRDAKGQYIIAKWFDGESYVLDFTRPFAAHWLNEQLNYLRSEYKVEGFKFDCGDAQFLPRDFEFANEQNLLWAKSVDIDNDCAILEIRSCYKYGGVNCVQRLADKAHCWSVEYANNPLENENLYQRYGLFSVLPGVLTQGITGYYYSCPDMVGGGLATDFTDKEIDDELLIRSCQCSALLPMIQFSHALWNSKNPAVRECMRQCLALREQFIDYIIELARLASKDGTPIVRYMEYEFPHCGMQSITTQFMLGDKYLVAPVTVKGQKQKNVYFPPETRWREWAGNKEYGSGRHTLDITLESLPIFSRIK